MTPEELITHIRELIKKEGYTEQECGYIQGLQGEEGTNFYNENGIVITLQINYSIDEEELNNIKGIA